MKLLTPFVLALVLILLLFTAQQRVEAFSLFNNNKSSERQKQLPPLRIHGNKIVQFPDKGEAVDFVPHGVNSVGALWPCLGGYGIFDHQPTLQMLQSMKSWSATGMNIVRFSLNEDCWLDINNMPNKEYAGEKYQDAIESYINMLIDNGFYAIIELHWTAPGTNQARGQMPMPDADHAPAFWNSVAKRLTKYWGHVIFDVFNEPYPDHNTVDSTAAWECWRKGGLSCPSLNYTAAGMQSLVDAIRSGGSSNIIMLGGINYANSLTQWVQYMPYDPLHSLVASWHSYSKNYCNNVKCWEDTVLPVTQHVPVLAGEIGEGDCTTKYIQPLMTWLTSHKIGFLGWVWDNYSNCELGPSLVSDVDLGNCTDSYGCGFKQFIHENF